MRFPTHQLKECFSEFTNDNYERIHAARNKRLYQLFSVVVILHWIYLLVISYTFSGSIDWVLLFVMQLPGYVAFTAASFYQWRWSTLTKNIWYAIISYVGCIVPICVNYRTYTCLSESTARCQDSSRPGYLNNLLYATVGPLIMLTVFRNAFVFQLISNLAILSTIMMQVNYSPRITWLNSSLLLGAYVFFFLLRVNQNKNEYGIYEAGLKLQMELDQGTARLSQQDELAKTRELLTSYIYHEIRVPLNTVILSVDLLEDNFSLNKHLSKDENETFEQVKSGLAAVNAVVNDALDIRRLEEGRLQMTMSPFVFAKFMDSLVGVLRSSWERKGVNFSFELDERFGASDPFPMVVLGDSSRIRQIISNFVSNAVKFTPEGGTIKLSASVIEMAKDAVLMRVSVKDSGIGISQVNQARLFQPFVQIDPNKNQQGKGTGLGLNICAHLVKLLGGKIGVISEVDNGSEFWFEITLRLYMDTMPVGPDKPATPVVPKIARSPRRLHVLVTDDDYGTRTIMLKILSGRLGHSVDLAVDGLDCLARVSAAQQDQRMYDILFLDNKMPRMDGLDVINHLRSQGISQPIICLTGSTSPLEESQLHGAGATGVLLKPCKMTDIERVLRKLFP